VPSDLPAVRWRQRNLAAIASDERHKLVPAIRESPFPDQHRQITGQRTRGKENARWKILLRIAFASNVRHSCRVAFRSGDSGG
jgi:hypothetical protein